MGMISDSWAFSTTAALEALNFIQNKKLVKYSEQALIDCAPESMPFQGTF